MPFLFVALSVLAVVAMAATKAVSHSPPMLQAPPGPPPIVMQVGEIWGVQGTLDKTMTPEAWTAFHDTLSGMMMGLGAKIGALVNQGQDFAFQVQPVTTPVSIQIPMVSPPFTLTRAQKLNGQTAVSGRHYRRFS